MSTYIKTLTDEVTNDTILPRTTASAVTVGSETLETLSNDIVRFSSQTKTTQEKAQARGNINAQETISDLSTIRSGASAGATAYQKPATNIPKSDLAADVQTSLGKADTALQSHQSLAAYRTSSAQDAIDATKQDTLISSGASVGQHIKISAVDANGKPTSWATEDIKYTLTVTCVTQDGVTVTGQIVTVREGGASGQIFSTFSYNGQPVSVALPVGFSYYVSVSDTLASHFNPTTASGIITNANVAATLTYSDFSSIKTFVDIKAALNADTDLTELVGEQVTCSRNNATLTWDVADYDSANKTITLLLHDVLPNNMQYDPPQALTYFEDGLAAGNYFFKSGNANYYFTIATAIPEGGQIRATTSSFTTYSAPSEAMALETGSVSTTEISGATTIGTVATGNLNNMDRVNYGSNNFKESAIFALLNSDAAPNTNVIGTTKFCRPITTGSFGGLLYNFDPEALAVIDDTVWKCSANTTFEAPASMGGTCLKSAPYTVTAKFALASQKEIFGSYDGIEAGDTVYDLYATASAADRIKYRGSSAQWWWMRSPGPSGADNVRVVSLSGTVDDNGAGGSGGVVPACRISKSQ